jgi:hypothetical protein
LKLDKAFKVKENNHYFFLIFQRNERVMTGKYRFFLLFLICFFSIVRVLSQMTQQGPWNSPLKIAFSSDGVNFTTSNIFQDSSGVPHVIRWKGDTLICVFQWFRKPIPSPSWDRVAVKFSYNNGLDWTNPTPLNFLNFPVDYQRPFDPTVVTIGKDSLRIYFSSSKGMPQGGLDATVNNYSAVSKDGINFYFEPGARVDEASRQVIDPALIRFKNLWHFTAPRGAPQDGAMHYTSTDGLIFKEEPIIPSDFSHNWTGNLMVDYSGKIRFYGSGSKLWYSSSSDGFSWSGFTDTNLKGGDPAVIQLESNRYLAIYVGEPYNAGTVQVPSLSTTSISNITGTTALSGGNISFDGGATITGRGLVWSFNPSPTVALSTKTFEGGGVGIFTSLLTPLSPNTTYYVRAYAINSAGTGYGNELTFKTTPAAIVPTLTTTTISSITSKTAVSGGNISSDGGSNVTIRGVVWSTSPNPTISLTTKTTDGNGIGSFTSNIMDLLANTTYYVRAYAINSVGISYGNELVFKTNASPTLSVSPTTLSFPSTGGTQSLTIRSNTNWTTSEGYDYISVSPTSGNGDTILQIQCTANTSSQSRSGSISIKATGLEALTILFNQLGSQPDVSTALLTVDVSKGGKAPKDLLGVNIGPGTSVRGYQEAGIREIRTHDYYGPLDYWHYTVNALDTVTKRFRPTFDPTMESSYQWKESDLKMDSIIRNGFKPFFRLGISYPHHPGVPTYPPLDATGQGFQTFGEISRRTVMHYTKGWHKGFTYPIRYWEIWNEPDFKEKFWSGPQGTPINYFQLYKSASLSIKEVDASLKVGGPGLAYASLFFNQAGYVKEFMSYCQNNRLPLDFYSWHLYDIKNPQGIKAYADTVRTYLDKNGYPSAESFITEINPDLKGNSFQNSARGAAWVIGAFISCNQSPVDKFFWYRGVQLSPLAAPDGPSTGNLLWPGLGYKLYASFLSENIKTIPVDGEQVISGAFDRDTTSLQALAGQSVSRDTISVLISHLNTPSKTINIELNQIPWNGSARIILTRLSGTDRKLVVTELNGMVDNGRLRFTLSDASIPGACLLRVVRKQTSTGLYTSLPDELFELFPNPAKDYFNILSLGDIDKEVTVTLFNLNGQQLQTKKMQGLGAGEKIHFPLNRLESGIYFLQIKTARGNWFKKAEILR